MSDAFAPSDIPIVAGSPGAPVFSAPVPRRRRWLRRLVKTFAVLVVLVVLAPLALSLPFVRSWVASRASKAVGAEVTIAGASAWWTSGVDLEGVVVASPPGYDGPLVTVAKVHVDVALLRLLKGDVEATVAVTEPHLALRRKADGRWNFKEFRDARAASAGPADAQEPQEKEAQGNGPMLHLTITDGVVEAHGLGGRVERVSKIALRADMAADGALEGTLGALAEKAGLAGQDVTLTFSGGMAPGSEMPIELTIPELDLARLTALTEGLSDWQGVRGTARVDAKGVMLAAGGVRGQLTLVARGLEAHTADGVRVAVGTATGKVDVTERPGGAGAGAEITLALEQVEVVDGVGPDARTLNEPSVNLTLLADLGRDDSVRVSKLDVAAGQALRVRSLGPLSISAPGPAGRSLEGKAEVSADLARLSALKTFVPSLAPLRSGLLTASLEGRAEAGLDVGLGARVTNLALAPGDWAPEGYAEPDVTVQARFSRSKDGEMRVLVHGVKSALARVSGAKPFEARIGAGGAVSFAGPLDLAVDLDALSRALGGALGLAKGERLRGTFGAKGTATGTSEEGRFEATLAGRNLGFPVSWGPSRAQAALDGTVLVTWTRTALLGELKDLRGLGLEVGGSAALKRDATSTAFDGADLRVVADLAQVRALFGGKMGVAAESTLAGRLQSTLRVSSAKGARRIDGTTQVAALAYRGAPDGALLEEPALTLEHTLLLPRDEGPLTFETARLRGNGYAADLSGSSFGGGDERVDVRGTLEGEAARLAERVRSFLPPDYQDLTGSGRVTGRFEFAGAGTPLLDAGTANADFALGTWSAAGATLVDGRLTLARAKGAGPYQTSLTGTLNQGTATIGFGVTPAGEALGWRLVTALKGVDLSTVLVNHGAGKYLGYVLPTLVATDKSTPVLSGRLDADVDLAATDVSGEAARKTLAGRGTVALTQGTLGESTLFTAIGGGNGLGDVGKALQQVAPEVGQELANFQRSVAFQSLTSRFEVGGERIDVKESRLTGSALKIDTTGTVDFDQRVDLAMRLWIGSKGGERLKTVIPDQTLPLRVTNTLEKPKVVPDVKAGDLLKGALGGLLPKSGESPTDMRKRLEDEAKKLKDKLPGLFGK